MSDWIDGWGTTLGSDYNLNIEVNGFRYQWPSVALNKQMNTLAGRRLLGEATNLLRQVKNQMKFGLLGQYQMTRRFNDGSVIFARSVFGQDFVSISVPEGVLRKEEEQFLLPIMGIMAQFEDGKIFFESHNAECFEHVYIDLADHEGLLDAGEGARLLRLVDDEAWAGIIVFHKQDPPYPVPGVYNAILFKLDKPSDPEVRSDKADDPYPHNGKYRKYTYLYRKITLPDMVSDTDAPILETTFEHPGRIVTDTAPWRWSINEEGSASRSAGAEQKWCDIYSEYMTCWYSVKIEIPAYHYDRNPYDYSYSFSYSRSPQWSSWPQGCYSGWYCVVGGGYTVPCGYAANPFSYTYEESVGPAYVSQHIPDNTSHLCKLIVIGARVWWNEGVGGQRPFENLKYELIGHIESQYRIDIKWRFHSAFIFGGGDCGGLFAAAFGNSGVDEERGGYACSYKAHFMTRTMSDAWGPWEDPIGYRNIFVVRNTSGSWWAYPDFGSSFDFYPTGNPKRMEKIQNLHECYHTKDGKHILTFTTALEAFFVEPAHEERVYYRILEETENQRVGTNQITDEEWNDTYIRDIWSWPGTWYLYTLQKGGGFKGRKMFRTAGNDLVYLTPALYVKDQRGTVWIPKEPPMKKSEGDPPRLVVHNIFGPVSKEIIMGWSLPKIPVCDSAVEYDVYWDGFTTFNRVNLTAKFLSLDDLFATCEYSFGFWENPYGYTNRTFGTGKKQADYSIKVIKNRSLQL